MKRRFKKRKKLVKGMPSAVVLSILIHAGLFLLAGLLVVFTVLPKPPTEFVPPPPVKVPKIPLKKLKVRTKKPSKPKASAKLTAVVKKIDLQTIAFPDLPSSGIGAGIGGSGGSGGFGDLEGFLEDDVSFMGGKTSIGNDIKGTYYDTKRTRSGNYKPADKWVMREYIHKFINSGWNTSVFNRFYKSDQNLYAQCMMLPSMTSHVAPAAFGEDPASGFNWLVHYKGQIVYPEDITFRFWGAGDEILAVRLGGKMVLVDIWQTARKEYSLWMGKDPERKQHLLGFHCSMEVGDWVTLKAGEPQEIEMLLGDDGGLAAFGLLVQVKGVDYPINSRGAPILPVFRTAPLSHDMLDIIYKDLPINDCCLTKGPIFCDFNGGDPYANKISWEDEMDEKEAAEAAAELEQVVKVEEPDSNEIRQWTLVDGREFDARYLSMVGNNVIMENHKGTQKKIPMDSFTPDDIEWFELENPPQLNVDFRKKSKQMQYSNRYPITDWQGVPSVLLYTFGAKVEQRSSGDYKHELNIEFFAIASQRHHNDKYVLVDRQSRSFTLDRENDYRFDFWSSRIAELEEYTFNAILSRGKKYESYLILITDKNGKVIASKSPNKWLIENVDELRKRGIGNYIDRSCKRVFPGRPGVDERADDYLRVM